MKSSMSVLDLRTDEDGSRSRKVRRIHEQKKNKVRFGLKTASARQPSMRTET